MPTPLAQTLAQSLAEALAQCRTALGLTQADLARQAGCTRQYVAQLERGERTRPSITVASGLARGLRLTGTQRRAWLMLAGYTDAEPAPREGVAVDQMAADLLNLIPAPAVLHDGTWHMSMLNAAAREVLTHLGFDGEPGRSLLFMVFDERHRAHYPQWEPWARYVLAQFKRDSAPLSHTPAYTELLRELRTLKDFTRLWRHVDPAEDTTPMMPIQYQLPGQPTLTFTLARMQFVNTPELWGIVFLPA